MFATAKMKQNRNNPKGISTATDPITRSTFFNHGIRHVTFYFPVSNLLLGEKSDTFSGPIAKNQFAELAFSFSFAFRL